MAETPCQESGPGMDAEPQTVNEIEVITDLNAPMSEETLRKLTSGVSSQNSLIYTREIAPNRVGYFRSRSANQMLGAETTGNTAQNEISGCQNFTMTPGNMATPIDRQRQSEMSVYQQQLLETQRMFMEQQNTVKNLTEAVNKIQNEMSNSSYNTSQTRKKRKIHEISSDESELSDIESGEYKSSSSDDDENEPSNKREMIISSSDRKKKLLKSVERSFGSESDLGTAVDSELAKTVNKGLSASVDHKSERIKSLLSKYRRPENCEYLDVPKVAKSIWTSKQTAKDIKDSDKALQRTQTYLTQGLIPLVLIMEKTLKTESEEAEQLFDLAIDSFKLLAQAHRDFSSQRKRMLTPAISSKYRGLCGESSPITATQLFGDDLTQQIKDIEESNKICNKLSWKDGKTYKSGQKDFKDYNKFQGQSRYKKGNYYKSNSFLEKRGPRSHINKNQKKGNLGRHQK